jgi:hypothetical protein
MNERSAKIAVVVVGLFLTLGVVVWRSAKAMKEVEAEAPAAGWSLDVISENRAAEPYDASSFIGLETVDGLAAEKLALVEFRGTRASIDRSYEEHTDFQPIRKKQAELGANVSVKEAVEDLPDDPGMAKLRVSLWLVHAGPVPKALVKSRHQTVCVITWVDPAGDAHKHGLRAGDVWTEVETTHALEQGGETCSMLTATSKATAVGSDVRFLVYRKAARTELTIHKSGPMLKFRTMDVPVLDADRT